MDKMKVAFELLNEELQKAKMELTIICVGGYVLQYHDLRATYDVDAFFESNQKISQIVYKVGEQLGLNTQGEIWLNNSVSSLNPQPPLSLCETMYSFGNLTVLMPSIEYVLGMKLKSGRSQDVRDVGTIVKHKGSRSPFAVYDELSSIGFSDIDFSMLLEGFSYAYGMDWLENFYVENEEKLRRYF